jgi:uncharacterized protein (TIGR00255 family)
MPHSMTGYACGSFEFQDSTFQLEIKSVNHRYRELNTWISNHSTELEIFCKSLIEKRVSRGKISFSLKGALNSLSSTYEINTAQLNNYVEAAKKLAEQSGLDVQYTARDFFKLPGVLQENKEQDWQEEFRQALEPAIDVLLDDFLKAREEEGSFLCKEMLLYSKKLRELVSEIEEYTKDYKEELLAKLKEKMEVAVSAGLDESRLHIEAALIAERADVSEELVRLASHLDTLDQLLVSDKDVGKKLNFLCQELNREINTTGSKSSQVEITDRVIECKTVLEKIREQVQNIE